MPGERSIFTEVGVSLLEKWGRLREEAEQTDAIPFMEEKLPRRQAVQRLQEMGEEQRREMLARYGREAMLKIVRGRGRHGSS